MIRQLTLAAAAATLSFGTFAQSALHYKEGQRVDPYEVAHILAAAPAMKTRSVRLLADPAAQQAAATPSALSLPVRFAFNSADIAPAARPQLDALAEGIKMLPPGQPVLVEGHTDAVGPDQYNVKLSEERAETVKRYLVRQGIDASRLRTAGVGKAEPIDGTSPFAPENRRVQFRGG